jgi:hypothetical protein
MSTKHFVVLKKVSTNQNICNSKTRIHEREQENIARTRCHTRNRPQDQAGENKQSNTGREYGTCSVTKGTKAIYNIYMHTHRNWKDMFV